MVSRSVQSQGEFFPRQHQPLVRCESTIRNIVSEYVKSTQTCYLFCTDLDIDANMKALLDFLPIIFLLFYKTVDPKMVTH